MNYLEGEGGGASFVKFDFRKEDRISRGIQKRRVKRIPAAMDPNMVQTREVSNFHRRNLIETGEAAEF